MGPGNGGARRVKENIFSLPTRISIGDSSLAKEEEITLSNRKHKESSTFLSYKIEIITTTRRQAFSLRYKNQDEDVEHSSKDIML